MSISFFTDASYSPHTGLGIIVTMEVVDGIAKEPIVTEHIGIKNSQLEKMGIKRCIDLANERLVTIYTDCESGIKDITSDKISFNWIKGHKKSANIKTGNDIFFRKVDILARRELRRIVDEFNMNKIH